MRLPVSAFLGAIISLAVLSACNSEAPTPSPTQVAQVEKPPVSASGTPSLKGTPAEPGLSQPRLGTPQTTAQVPPELTPFLTFVVITPEPSSTATAEPAPTAVVADSGFKVIPDGYSFENYKGKKKNGKPVPELAVSDLIKMFGESDVCVKLVNGVCTPRQEAIDWLDEMNSDPPGGHCEGMAVSSLLMFKGLDSPSVYQDGSKTTYDLKLNDKVKSLISYYYYLQMVEPVATEYSNAEQHKPSEVLDTVIASLKDGAPDPVNLGFYGGEPDSNGYLSGHSITPYNVVDMGNGLFRIYVYDNNWPDRTDVYMEIDRNNETWSYDLSARDPSQAPMPWKGDAETQTLGALPLSVRTGTLICPWCDDSGSAGSSNNTVGSKNQTTAAANLTLTDLGAAGPENSDQRSSSMQVMLDGDGHLLIKNSNGQRLGFDGTKVVNEIPGARYVAPRGGLGTAGRPVFYLPKGQAYSMTLDGQSTGGTTSSVSLFGQGVSIKIQNLALTNGDKHELSLSSDARKLSFVAGNSTIKPTFRIATSVKKGDGASAETTSYLFQAANFTVAQGQQLDFSLDKAQGSLDIKANDGTAGVNTYDLDITRSNQAGTETYSKANLTLKHNDTHSLNFQDWSTGEVSVSVDQGSNGVVDSTQTVPTAPPATPTTTEQP